MSCFCFCHFAPSFPSLPRNTVLLGLDFGSDNLFTLFQYVKAKPQPVLTVTRAMQAEDDLAEQVADTLHATEGCIPLPIENIPDFLSEVSDTSSVVTDLPQSNVSDTLLDNSDSPQSVSSQLSSSCDSSLTPISIPSLSFDGGGGNEIQGGNLLIN